MKVKNLLMHLRLSISVLEFDDRKQLDYILRRLDMVVIKLYGESSHCHNRLLRIQFEPKSSTAGEIERREWAEARDELENFVKTLLEEIKLFGVPGSESPSATTTEEIDPRNVFVVHGHDEAVKEAVARTIGTLGLTPIILHEQPDQGRTIIEKFTDYSNVGFAVVLLSPDDEGYSVAAGAKDKKFRARQNVILELGFFLGKLGRSRVVALHKGSDLELPSDYDGVLYTPYDNSGAWKLKLAKELNACGYDIDANRLM